MLDLVFKTFERTLPALSVMIVLLIIGEYAIFNGSEWLALPVHLAGPTQLRARVIRCIYVAIAIVL